MVSIRYFWRVGEFRCVKSKPRGSFASKIGTARPSRESLWMKSRRLILLIRYEHKPSRTRTPFESVRNPSRRNETSQVATKESELVRAMRDEMLHVSRS